MKFYCLLLFLLVFQKTEAQDEPFTNATWQQLEAELIMANIVGLGEVGHGYESINEAKASVLNFLRLHAGFQSVVFESSFTLATISYLKGDSLETRMKNSLYPFWINPSIQAALFPFSEREKNLPPFNLRGEKHKPLISGMDIQEDCRFKMLSAYLITEGLVKKNIEGLVISDSILNFYIGEKPNTDHALSPPELNLLIRTYDSVISELRLLSLSEIKKNLLLHALENRKWLCTYLTLSNNRDQMYYRDSLMAGNLVWLKTNLYQYEKIALWSTDLHLSQLEKNEKPQWVGEWISLIFKKSYFPISFKKGSHEKGKMLQKAFGLKLEGANKKFRATVFLNKLEKIRPEAWNTECH